RRTAACGWSRWSRRARGQRGARRAPSSRCTTGSGDGTVKLARASRRGKGAALVTPVPERYDTQRLSPRVRSMALRRSILITSLLVLGRAAAQQPPDSSRSPMDTGRAVPPPLTSQTVITGDMLNRLPIDDPRQALMLAPGGGLRSAAGWAWGGARTRVTALDGRD